MVNLFGREGLGKLEVLLVAESEPVGDELQVSSHRRHTREAKVSRVHQWLLPESWSTHISHIRFDSSVILETCGGGGQGTGLHLTTPVSPLSEVHIELTKTAIKHIKKSLMHIMPVGQLK